MCKEPKLILSADPQSLPVVIIVFTHVVRPSVPTFQNLAKQNKFQAKTMFTTGKTVGLAEWIINDICLVYDCFGPLRILNGNTGKNIS